MHALGFALLLASIVFGVLLCRTAARAPRCPTCSAPTEAISINRGDRQILVVETAFWCPRCALIVSRHYATPHWE